MAGRINDIQGRVLSGGGVLLGTDEMRGVGEWLGYREGEIESLMAEVAWIHERFLEVVVIT